MTTNNHHDHHDHNVTPIPNTSIKPMARCATCRRPLKGEGYPDACSCSRMVFSRYSKRELQREAVRLVREHGKRLKCRARLVSWDIVIRFRKPVTSVVLVATGVFTDINCHEGPTEFELTLAL